MTGADLLFDPVRLAADDRHGLLPAAATAGAQVRATAEQVAALGELSRPRALVVVGARAETTGALVAACATSAAAPIIAVPRLPGWIGPLDVVVVLAAASDDPIAARAADTAQRRGATVVVRGATTGPVAAAAPAGLIVPAIGAPEALAESGRCTVVAAVAAALGLLPAPDWAAAADLLDAIALACHPQSEPFVNPALALAAAMSAGVPLLVGADPVADAVTRHAETVLAEVAGVAAGRITSAIAMASPVALRRAAAARDLFADPDDAPRMQPVLVSAPDLASGEFDVPVGRALRQALPGAFAVSTDDLGSDAQRSMTEPGVPTPAAAAPDPLACVLGLVSRFDFAATYLALTLGSLPLYDGPDGLARRGSARTGVRAAVVDPTPSREPDDDWR